MTAHELLIAARALIADPENWTQGWEARDAGGNRISASSPDAASRCADGALWCVVDHYDSDMDAYDAALERLNATALNLGWNGATFLNDDPGTTHADVLRMFDAAIAATAETV